MKLKIDSIRATVGKTGFDLIDEDGNYVLESRTHGDVCNGLTGRADREEGNRLKCMLRGAGIKCTIEAVDEWVTIAIPNNQ